MKFIFRREECNVANFLLWQTEKGAVVSCREVALSAVFMVAVVAILLLFIDGVGLLPCFILFLFWAALFILYCIRCDLLPVKRPFSGT